MDSPGTDPVWLKALGWVETRRGEFAIPEGPPGPEMLVHLKAVGELARTCSVLLRGLADEGVRTRLGSLLRWAWSTCREGALFLEILERRPSLLMAGALYSIFDREGLRHDATRQLLARLGREPISRPPRDEAWEAREASGIRLSSDAPAVLALGLAEGWKAMDLPCRWNVERLLPQTILGARPEGELGVDDSYSVAHAILFATAFGSDVTRLDERARAWVQRRIPPILTGFLGIPNLDVFSELVFALACVGPPVGAERWEDALRSAQRPDGSFPAPSPRDLHGPTAKRKSGGGGQESTSFRRDYHVTLAAILASCALSRSTS